MPIINVEQFDRDTKILIWHILENDHFFIEKLLPQFREKRNWEDMRPKRKSEWLASRYLLQLGLPSGLRVKDLTKDEYGCPYLPKEKIFCGISHTENYTAVVLSKNRVGCDIERFKPKIKRIAPKFLTDNQLEWVQGDKELAKMHLIWGIKESAFKTWGKRNIDWKRDILIDPIKSVDYRGEISGQIGSQQVEKITYFGHYLYHPQFVFVWTKET